MIWDFYYPSLYFITLLDSNISLMVYCKVHFSAHKYLEEMYKKRCWDEGGHSEILYGYPRSSCVQDLKVHLSSPPGFWMEFDFQASCLAFPGS